ncbi:MAG: L-ascorbate metabolism protein UlaG (beta-lactamase superfamily) [Alphaproteobacteria bacterium]|jgi:L-ascorbate metabolism protein UlaG (beta-lactamase superfamily)
MRRYPVFAPKARLTAALFGACALAFAPAPAQALAQAQAQQPNVSCFPTAQLNTPRAIPAGFRVSGLGASPFARAPFTRTQAVPTIPGLPNLPRGMVQLSYLGHSSFLLRTPQNVTVITDYNGLNRAGFPPEVVTMNHAHESHYTDFIEPGVKHVLRGWFTVDKGYPRIDLKLRDIRIRNVATNIRNQGGGTEFAGNSMFIFETAGLCIAHFGHLHHELTRDRLGRIGQIDVAMVPVDGGMTLPHDEMAKAVAALGPKMVVPMHVFGTDSLHYFITLMEAQGYRLLRVPGPDTLINRAALSRRTVLVFPEGLF